MPEKHGITAIMYNGERYAVGDKLKSIVGTGASGEITDGDGGPVSITIFCIETDHIGVVSDYLVPGWHSLDNRTEIGHGYYFRAPDLANYFIKVRPEHYIIEDGVNFKNRSLKGMSCTPLRKVYGSDMYFVELSENVGAGGADGLGKSGHCVLVPVNKLKRKQVKEKKHE